MAFPIPPHLPRQGLVQDSVSTKILSNLDDHTYRTLNSQLVSRWIAELDETILETRTCIHDRIQQVLPAFDHQQQSVESVRTKLQTLSADIDQLSHALSNSETGLLSIVVNNLRAHVALAQDSSDADVAYDVLAHLLRCWTAYRSVTSLVDAGKLPDAVSESCRLEELLRNPPEPLAQASVTADLKHKFRAAKDRLEEQLSEAYSRSVIVLPSELVIRTAVQVRQSEVVLPLSSVLASASAASVSAHMSTLRRDLVSQYINQILQQPLSVEISATMDSAGTTENKLILNLRPLSQENLTARLDNLSAALTFLSIKLFPHLPPSHRDSFPKLLCQPIARSLLADLLILSLPSSFAELHVFLHLVENAVRFEDEYLIQLLGNPPGDRPIKEWAEGVIGHYERKRRVNILEAIRSIVVNRGTTSASTFRVDSIPDTHSEPLPVLPVESQPPPGTPKEAEDVPNLETDEDGWGFENDVEPVIESATGAGSNPRDEEDPADAWGWSEEDDSEPSDDSAAWDDPWNEPDADLQTSLSLPTRPEKVASKSTTGRANGAQALKMPLHDQTPLSAAPFPEPIKTFAPVSKETYLVSMRAKEVITIVKRVLDEAAELSASKDLPRRLDSASPPGAVLLQSVISSLELFLALYPVTFSADMASHPKRTMQFTNDCIYLSGETERIRAANVNVVGIVGKLNECGDMFKLWGESSFWDNVDVQCRSVDDTLSRVEGFTFTAEQDRYDECEGAINQVLNNICSVARLWKPLLPKSKYYTAIGSVVDAALSKVLDNILKLPDITADESHRLSELCRILHALEALFVEDLHQPSFVLAYVPCWLKFSYLSELLEASIADITYLFDEGALVDFDVSELVTLIRALFADTPLRTTTTNRILGGHPSRE